MATAKRFEDLEIWQMSRKLVNEVYEVTNKQDFAKDYGLKDQIRRASVSVMNNISEGFESRTVKKFINYLGLSKASCGETRSILYVAIDLEYITQDEFDKLYLSAKNISGKIQNLIQYLDSYNSNNRIEDVIVEYKAK